MSNSIAKTLETIEPNRRQLLQGATAAAAASLLTHAVNGQVSSQENPTQLVYISREEPPTLFAGAPGGGAATTHAFNAIASGLGKFSFPDYDIVPDLATEWTQSEDGLIYDVTLREGVTWHDGAPFTAADVKFTFELLNHPDFPTGFSNSYARLDGARAYKNGEAEEITGIEILDDTHVRFSLTEPDALFVTQVIRGVRILPRHVLGEVAPAEAVDHDFARQPIYTGPFKIREWRSGESITYEANPDYYGGAPGFDVVVQRFVPDPSTVIAELESGGAQVAFVLPDQFGAFDSNADFNTQLIPGTSGERILVDNQNPLFQDKRLRQALSHAIDREAILGALYLGLGDPSYSLVPPNAPVFNPDAPQFPYDPDAAKALLDEAGWAVGSDGIREKDGQRLSFRLTVAELYEIDGLALQPYFTAVGIETELIKEGAGLSTGTKVPGSGDYDAYLGKWVNFMIDPRSDLQSQFGSANGPQANSGFESAEIDAALAAARSALTPVEEHEHYQTVQELAYEEAIFIYTWRKFDLAVAHTSVTLPEATTQTEFFARVNEWRPAE